MAQRTVLKVDVSCLKCKKKLLKAISSLEGVDKIEADAAKGTIAVTGNADPYEIIVRTRKAGKHAEVLSIGPPPKPDNKKPDNKAYYLHDPYSCPQCQGIVLMPVYDQPNPSCSIL